MPMQLLTTVTGESWLTITTPRLAGMVAGAPLKVAIHPPDASMELIIPPFTIPITALELLNQIILSAL